MQPVFASLSLQRSPSPIRAHICTCVQIHLHPLASIGFCTATSMPTR